MNTTDLQTDDTLTWASAKPQVDALIEEYKRCSPAADGWNRLQTNDEVRYAQWGNQTLDGKKHSSETEKAFPFENAADGQIFLADAVINELVAICVVSFWRAMVRATGAQSTEDKQELGANATKVMEWLVNTRMKRELVREVELSAQYLLTYGNAVLKPTWTRELGKKLQRLTFAQVQQIAQAYSQGDPQSVMAQLPAMILDPALEDAAVDIVRQVATEMVQQGFSEVLGDEGNAKLEGYTVSKSRARAFVRSLRDEGQGEIPVPFFFKNQPSIFCLKPWEEVFWNPEAADLQQTRVFEIEFLNEVQLRSRAALEGWDEEWVEQAATLKGRFSAWSMQSQSQPLLNVEWQWNYVTQQSELIEVIHGYTPQVDTDGIRCVYHTIFSAHISKSKDGATALAAKHELLDLAHGQMPFVVGCRERTRRRITSSRGLPQLLNTRQREVKVQRDALLDHTSVSVFPPLNVYEDALGTKYNFGPAVQNTVILGREPKFMDVPARGTPVAFELMQVIQTEVQNDFGLAGQSVPVTRQQTKQQMLVNTFLLMWSEAFQQMFALVEQFLPDAEYQRVTGAKAPLPKGDAIARQDDLVLHFDVRELDMDYVLAQYKAITMGVLPFDTDNVVDKSKLISIMLRAINPSLAGEVVRTPQAGQEQVMAQVQNDLMRMMLGFTPEYGKDADPAAQMKMQAAQQLLQTNPKLQQAMQQDPQFQEQIKEYGKNIQFNLEQQQNKGRGRTGV